MSLPKEDNVIYNGVDLLSLVIKENNNEKIKSLIDLANKNKFILKLNEKDEDEGYPLLNAINKNNIEMVQLLMNYSSNNNIILELNEKDKDGDYPLLLAIRGNKGWL